MKQYSVTHLSCGLVITFAALALPAAARAETITIGKGSGIMWEGLPFNETLAGPLQDTGVQPRYGLLAISSIKSYCLSQSSLVNIAGYRALPITNVPGVGLVPRATGVATYTRPKNVVETLTGTIGLPETVGNSTSQVNIRPQNNYLEWCLPPITQTISDFYKANGDRVATLSGTWVLVADGTQKAGKGKVPAMYFGSYSSVARGDRIVQILPTDIDLRISTLECTVNTPTAINFGAVGRDLQAGAELAVKTVPLMTSCGQASDYINANINLQFRAISGLFNSEPSRLALNQGGGYITGEIDDGVTGSGNCTATSGLRFDGQPVKLGSISTAETSKTLTNQINWRLCSGGASLPVGAVTASTEMLVTFN